MLFSSYLNQKRNLAIFFFIICCEILRKSPAMHFRADRRMDVSIRFANAPNETFKKVLDSLTFVNTADGTGPINDRKFAGLAE